MSDVAKRPLTDVEQAMVVANMKLVGKFVSRRYHGDWRHDELVSAGYRGLIRAVQKYDPSIGKFSHYALWWIRNFVQEEKRKLMFYRVGANHYNVRAKGMSEKTRKAGARAIQAQQVSWSEVEVVSVLAVHRDPEIADHEILYREVDALPLQHQAVLFACVQDGRPERAVADELGISQTRVRQIRDVSIRKLRNRLARLEKLGAL